MLWGSDEEQGLCPLPLGDGCQERERCGGRDGFYWLSFFLPMCETWGTLGRWVNCSSSKFLRVSSRTQIQARLQTEVKFAKTFLLTSWGPSKIKTLWVTTDDQFCWKSHNKHVQTKVSRSIIVLNETKQVKDHCSPVIPYLNYCAEVLGNINISWSSTTYSVLKKTTNYIDQDMDHTNSSFLQSELLKLKDLMELQTAQIICKVKINLLSGNIQKQFT